MYYTIWHNIFNNDEKITDMEGKMDILLEKKCKTYTDEAVKTRSGLYIRAAMLRLLQEIQDVILL